MDAEATIENRFDSQLPSSAVFHQVADTVDNDEDQQMNQAGSIKTIVILATAMVKIQFGTDISQPVRALMDAGGQISVITKQCAKRLKLRMIPCCLSLDGIGGHAGVLTRKVRVFLRNRFDDSNFQMAVELFVIEDWHSIQPQQEINKEKAPFGHQLADNNYHKPAPLELLLGAEVWANTVGSTVFRNKRGAMMQTSSLGMLALGKFELRPLDFPNVIISTEFCANTTSSSVSDHLLAEALRRFWQWEEAMDSSKLKLTTEEQQVEKYFLESHYRNKEGRYVVFIPIKAGVTLGDSRATALRRFHQLERRLQGSPSLREAYVRDMREEEDAGFIQIADRPPKGMVYYIPHHPVLRKFRIVDDASCRTTNGKSLNDMQMIGPKLQFDLNDQIMRFRRHKFAFMADIKKMFKQVKIDPSQWDLMRIFWRESPQLPLKEYWRTTVIFGMSSSVHNACRAMIQCARDHAARFPDAARVIEEDFYMDDGLSGAETIESAKVLCREVDHVLKQGGFELRNWSSNCEEIEELMQSKVANIVQLEAEDSTKLLGLNWLKATDELAIRVKTQAVTKAENKRKILGEIAAIYDPSGYIGPVTVLAKIMMQDLWRKPEFGWDEKLPIAFVNRWKDFYGSLRVLSNFRIPRWIGTDSVARAELHAFADASGKAYGCVVYVRAVNESGRIAVNLMLAKSKVAPIKAVSIPRLELQAAVLLSNLIKHIKQVCEFKDMQYNCWTDSTIVLYWLKKRSPQDLKTYVSNRVAMIAENTSIRRWAHIDTKQNPADLISRGLSSEEILKSQLWLHGPEWLSNPRISWPVPKLTIAPEAKLEIDKEVKPAEIFAVMACAPIENSRGMLLLRYSSWRKIVRVTAIIARFVHNCRQKDKKNRRSGHALTAADTADAVNYWTKCAQGPIYHAEIECLRAKDTQLPGKSKIAALKPFLDEKGVLRVGGRIGKSPYDFGRKHPIIIPPRSRLSYLMLAQAHTDTFHGGVQIMMAHIRDHYWIPSLRSEARQYVNSCVICKRYAGRTEEQLMAALPAERVTPARPFSRCGVDMAGPFLFKGRCYNTRALAKEPLIKGWIAVFICLVTRAVHLEMVSDISADAFKNAFLRFNRLRGPCHLMMSDNGTNFVGAEAELREARESWQDPNLQYTINDQGCEWRFITPSAPFEGGLWEAAVKSMKHHLRRVMGPHKYTWEGITTLLAGVEACLNSRPLCAMSDDPSDDSILTPAHFINGGPLRLPLPTSPETAPVRGKKLYELIRQQETDFWKAWSCDYLSSLMQRAKWRKERENIQIGMIVLIQSGNYAPTYWQMGRIIEVHAGSDGLVRSATIKVESGTLERPIRKLCVLPTDEEYLRYWKD